MGPLCSGRPTPAHTASFRESPRARSRHPLGVAHVPASSARELLHRQNHAAPAPVLARRQFACIASHKLMPEPFAPTQLRSSLVRSTPAHPFLLCRPAPALSLSRLNCCTRPAPMLLHLPIPSCPCSAHHRAPARVHAPVCLHALHQCQPPPGRSPLRAPSEPAPATARPSHHPARACSWASCSSVPAVRRWPPRQAAPCLHRSGPRTRLPPRLIRPRPACALAPPGAALAPPGPLLGRLLPRAEPLRARSRPGLPARRPLTCARQRPAPTAALPAARVGRRPKPPRRQPLGPPCVWIPSAREREG
jgi:hypothetical protein